MSNRYLPYNGNFLYPPRIEYKAQPISLKKFDNGEFIAQPKLDGSNTSVSINENVFLAKERHNTFFARPPKFDFLSLYSGFGYMCLAGEYLNKSKKGEDNKPLIGFCIWDILAYNGQILIGSTIEERLEIIDRLYPTTSSRSINGINYIFATNTKDIYKVANYSINFSNIYDTISKIDVVEGLVLKRKSGQLEMMTREQNNIGWAIKVRKPTLNYKF
jgi:hypothetical protein